MAGRLLSGPQLAIEAERRLDVWAQRLPGCADLSLWLVDRRCPVRLVHPMRVNLN